MLNEILEKDSAFYSILYNAYLYQTVAKDEIPSIIKLIQALSLMPAEKKDEVYDTVVSYHNTTQELTNAARLAYYDSKESASKLIEKIFFKRGNLSDERTHLLQSFIEHFDDILF